MNTPTPAPTPTPTPELERLIQVPTSSEVKNQAVKIDVIVSNKDDSNHDRPVANVTVKDTSVDVGIFPSIITDAIQVAKEIAKNEGTKTTATFDLTVSEGFTSVSANFPKKSMDELVNNIDNLAVKTPFATITLDNKAISTVTKLATADIKIDTAVVSAQDLSEQTKELVGDKPVFNFTITSNNKPISNFGNGKVTVSIPYTLKSGEAPNGILIYYINASGKLEVVKHCKYNEETGEVTFSTNHFSKYTIGYKSVEYLDVAASSAYANAIDFVSARELFSGVEDKIFAADQVMTRAMFISVLARLDDANLAAYRTSTYSDVEIDAWYGRAAVWADRVKLIINTTGKFNPNESITREEMAVLFSNYLKYKNITPTVVDTTAFKDSDRVSANARTAVADMKKYGLMVGVGNNEFGPTLNVTRGTVAVIFMNFINGLLK